MTESAMKQPQTLKRAKAGYTNDDLLLLALQNDNIKPYVESVTFDKNEKVVYIKLMAAQPWSFWQQLIPLIVNPEPWYCREDAEQFALKKSFTYVDFTISSLKKPAYIPIRKTKTWPQYQYDDGNSGSSFDENCGCDPFDFDQTKKQEFDSKDFNFISELE